jgi:hypothetical protein
MPKTASGEMQKGKRNKTEKAQSARFKEIARERGVDESPENFELAFSKLFPLKQKGN